MKRELISFLALVILLMPISTYAGDSPEAQAEMEEVVVTAGRVKEKKKDVTSNMNVITEQEIRDSSADNLGDLLAERGIGHIHKYPGASTSVGIRGFRTSTVGNDLMGYVLVLLDGRRAGTGNLYKIMTKNIERVEIIRGPASVQYGSAAMGGIVNVITKRGKERPQVFVEGMLGSFDYSQESVGFSGKFKGFDFSGAITYQSRDDYYTAEGDKYPNTAYDEERRGSINLGYEFLPGNRIGVTYTSFKGDDMGNPEYMSNPDLDDYKDTLNRSIDFVYEGKTSQGTFSWMARYFQGKDENKWFDPVESNPTFFDDGIPSETEVEHQGGQAQFTYNQDYLQVTTGMDWVNYETKNDPYSPRESEYTNPAYFIMPKVRLLNKKLILSGGLRYDDYEVEIKKGEGGRESDENISPRIGAAYMLTDFLKLRAHYGEAFKMPSADQLAANYPGMFGVINYIGNPHLDPEESRTYEGGMDLSYRSLEGGLTYFYTSFDDKIEQYTMPSGDISWDNLGEATLEGIEGRLSYDIGSLFSWDYQVKPYVSFVYLTEYEDEEANENLKYTSDLTASYGISVSDFSGFSADLNFCYTGEQWVEDWQSPLYPPPVIEKGGFTVANLTVQKRILDFHRFGSITLKGEIRNLLDKDYAYIKGYPMPGRSFFLGMRYDWGKR